MELVCVWGGIFYHLFSENSSSIKSYGVMKISIDYMRVH